MQTDCSVCSIATATPSSRFCSPSEDNLTPKQLLENEIIDLTMQFFLLSLGPPTCFVNPVSVGRGQRWAEHQHQKQLLLPPERLLLPDAPFTCRRRESSPSVSRQPNIHRCHANASRPSITQETSTGLPPGRKYLNHPNRLLSMWSSGGSTPSPAPPHLEGNSFMPLVSAPSFFRQYPELRVEAWIDWYIKDFAFYPKPETQPKRFIAALDQIVDHRQNDHRPIDSSTLRRTCRAEDKSHIPTSQTC